jgi:hypothetical protein
MQSGKAALMATFAVRHHSGIAMFPSAYVEVC